jgi:hypothetical protein
MLGTFPTDDAALNAIEHALGACFKIDDNGEHVRIGADYSLGDLCRFYSGYRREAIVSLSEDVVEYVGGPVYTVNDIIAALITQVRQYRGSL